MDLSMTCKNPQAWFKKEERKAIVVCWQEEEVGRECHYWLINQAVSSYHPISRSNRLHYRGDSESR